MGGDLMWYLMSAEIQLGLLKFFVVIGKASYKLVAYYPEIPLERKITVY